jgi:TatD DNase family protein
VEQLAESTTANARRLFRLGSGDPGTLVYDLQGHLYVNLTNRCSADCVFCPRRVSRMLQTYDLTLGREPLAADVIAAIGDPGRYQEIVFCGFGEPTLRWPVLKQVAQAIKPRSRWVRVNTNGQGELIQGMDLLSQARGVVDEWSVSLNSADPEDYVRLVKPAAGRQAFAAVLAFIERAGQMGFKVTVSAVEVPGTDMSAVRELAERLNGRFRGRIFQRLGEPENKE